MIEGSDSVTVCFGQQVRLLCIHPVIDPTKYYPKPSWLRNGLDIFPEGEITINETAVALDILVKRKDFENINMVTYECILRRRDFTIEKSNAVLLNPPGS